MKAGKYIIAVDALWNESTPFDPLYQDIIVDIYSPEQVTLEPVDASIGFRTLTTAFKKIAAQAAQASKENGAKELYYFGESSNYGNDVFSFANLRKSTGCRLGYVYTVNNSKYPLKSTLSINPFEGADFLYPPSQDRSFELDLSAGSDHIVLFKMTSGQCKYGYLQTPEVRQRGAEEFVEFAKNEQAKLVKGTEATLQISNNFDGACFLFTNEGKNAYSIKITGTPDTSNLELEGSKSGKIDFEITLQPQ